MEAVKVGLFTAGRAVEVNYGATGRGSSCQLAAGKAARVGLLQAEQRRSNGG